MTYLITFACYGCRLHGDAAGSVDRWHNAPGTPIVEEHRARAAFAKERMDQPPYQLDPTRRDAVLQAIHDVCAHRGWNLLAAHVRSNHVHTVVEADAPPERIMNDFKAYASRHLNRMGLEEPCRKRAPWKHTMALEAAACFGGHPVRSCRAGWCHECV